MFWSISYCNITGSLSLTIYTKRRELLFLSVLLLSTVEYIIRANMNECNVMLSCYTSQ